MNARGSKDSTRAVESVGEPGVNMLPEVEYSARKAAMRCYSICEILGICPSSLGGLTMT